MTFTVVIRIINDTLAAVEFSDNPQPVRIGAALQAVEAAKAVLLNVPVAQPEVNQAGGMSRRDEPAADILGLQPAVVV